MKLLLTSQGIQEEIKPVFLSMLPKPAKDISVSFVTTAAYGEDKDPSWLNIYRDQLRELGIDDIEDLDLKDKSIEYLKTHVSNKDIIFVNGGNSFYLLEQVKKSGFDKLINSFKNGNKIYVGISAGSYIACPTIEQSTWEHQDRNRYGLKDLTALNLIPFLITAHYVESYRPIIEKAVKTTKYSVVALNDNQAILVEDNRYKLVGDKTKNFFNNFQENW